MSESTIHTYDSGWCGVGKVFCLSVPALILIVCTRKERK